MKVVFRADASVQIGTGHIMRCLTLADELRKKGAEIFFICRLLPGNLCGLIEQKGYLVHRLPYPEQSPNSVTNHARREEVSWQTDAEETKTILAKEIGGIDWLVVDHYALDIRWETLMRPHAKKIMVIDDLADRPHDCDLLLDQNLYENMETRYQTLIPGHCLTLLGPGYVLLRPEFKKVRRNLRQRDGTVKRILIFFGGSDPTNETAKALKAVQLINRPEVIIDVVVGSTNLHKEEIQQLCSIRPNTSFYCQVENMAELMARADLAIGAGGTTTWERCFLGLPSITLIVAQNQADTTKTVAAKGAAWNLGWSGSVSLEILAEAIKMAMNDPVALKDMGLTAMRLMGEVSFHRENPVVQALLEDKNAVA
ncbi:MAG: UDP-2,4-diacetamido-2,4,6-trideoxy-beta-L-altropyranose hydrolase [Peptococcaceae bacterium]|nr:UDP-2,4-diacetamido-2,4,6-trideoxy-beta-L-altropyranose hydrolase [Peptococcaceae bacterium]